MYTATFTVLALVLMVVGGCCFRKARTAKRRWQEFSEMLERLVSHLTDARGSYLWNQEAKWFTRKVDSDAMYMTYMDHTFFSIVSWGGMLGMAVLAIYSA